MMWNSCVPEQCSFSGIRAGSSIWLPLPGETWEPRTGPVIRSGKSGWPRLPSPPLKWELPTIFWALMTFEIFYTSDAHRKVTALIRDVDPGIVLTHPPHDYMADHEITSRLVRSACFSGSVPALSLDGLTTSPNTRRIPSLYYSQPMEGKDIYGEPVPPGNVCGYYRGD